MSVRIGVNTFIWRSPFATDPDLDQVGHAAALGETPSPIATAGAR